MADTNGTVEFDAGRVNVSAHFPASAAVNTYLPLSKSQIAISTDDTRVLVKRGGVITDLISGPATGVIQVEINGDPVPVFIDLAAQQASNAGRKKMNIMVPGNSWLRFKVVTALPA